jgi:hypothetical protein
VYGESGRCPTRFCGVAGFTGSGDVQRQVVRINTLVVVAGVTTRTGIRCIGVIALVTVVAGCCCVRAREWPHRTVVKCRRYPCILIMTIGTTRRELLCNVVGVSGGIKVVSMASCASVWRVGVIALVTIIATHTRMRTNNGIKGVIEGGRGPCCLTVAFRTVGRELLRYVIRIGSSVEFIGMTT